MFRCAVTMGVLWGVLVLVLVSASTGKAYYTHQSSLRQGDTIELSEHVKPLARSSSEVTQGEAEDDNDDAQKATDRKLLSTAEERRRRKRAVTNSASAMASIAQGVTAAAPTSLPDWRSQEEKDMMCTVASNASRCSTRIYHGMGGRMEECQSVLHNCDDAADPADPAECEEDPSAYGVVDAARMMAEDYAVGLTVVGGTPASTDYITGIGPDRTAKLHALTANLPAQPIAGADCGFTIMSKTEYPAKTRTTNWFPGCCVGSSCTSENTCLSAKHAHLCTDFTCTVQKWSRCITAEGSKLAWRYRDAPRVMNGNQHTWYAEPHQLSCQSYKICSCEPPSNTNAQNKGCVASASKGMCSES